MGSFSREDVNQKNEGIPARSVIVPNQSDWMKFQPVARATTESLPAHLEHRVWHRPALSRTADSLSTQFSLRRPGTAWRRRGPGIGAEFERSAAAWSVSDDRI